MKQKHAFAVINSVCFILGYKIMYTVVRQKPYWLIVKK